MLVTYVLSHNKKIRRGKPMIKITEDNLDLILSNQKIPTEDDRDILLKLFKGKERVLYENAMIIVNVFNYGRIRGKQIERERRG